MESTGRAVEMYRTKKTEDTPVNRLQRIELETDRRKAQAQSQKEEARKNSFRFACVYGLVFSSLKPNTF